MKIGKIPNWLVFVLIAVFVFAPLSYAAAQAQSLSAETYSKIFDLIKKNFYLNLSDDEIVKIQQCILQRGFMGFEVSKDEKLENDIKIQSCFKEDKHTHYVSPSIVRQMQDQRRGGLSGIGAEVELTKDNSGAKVRRLLPGGPAESSHLLKENDVILAAGTVPDPPKLFKGLSLDEMVDLIRGPAGTTVVLEVSRDGKRLSLNIVRGEVKFKIIESKQLESGIGYLKINEWSKLRMVSEDIEPVLRNMAANKTSKLVLDLRGNPGGLLTVVMNFLTRFAPDAGMIMVQLRERGDVEAERDVTNRRGAYADWKIAVLVDERSASASEIAAGVLQIWGAKVFGTKTYGKGSVQTVFDLPDGGEFLLTTSKYYFSNGKTPDDGGIIPDVEVAAKKTDKGDPVLEKALEHLHGLR
ncbi:MAG: PDZ domain-containing protein [Parcubacteria group bacterium]|nr:PDZ domain-containing protein [Parcubacteria group bacterium]